jgi:hypothetical protein
LDFKFIYTDKLIRNGLLSTIPSFRGVKKKGLEVQKIQHSKRCLYPFISVDFEMG